MTLSIDNDTILLVMKNVVQSLPKFKKDTAIDLRKKGFSYSEIGERLKTPKSTLSLWLRKVKLTESQVQKLKNRRLETAKDNSRKRILKTSRMIEKIKNSSSKDISQISKRELWLIGIILYWKERNASGSESDVRNGVRFTSSDPYLIKLFLKWLCNAGGVEDDELKFDIFLGEDKRESVEAVKEAVVYWSKITGLPKDNFLQHIYFKRDVYKKSKQKKSRETIRRSQFGLLRIRVKASSMLARQIAGWIRGVQNYYWG